MDPLVPPEALNAVANNKQPDRPPPLPLLTTAIFPLADSHRTSGKTQKREQLLHGIEEIPCKKCAVCHEPDRKRGAVLLVWLLLMICGWGGGGGGGSNVEEGAVCGGGGGGRDAGGNSKV